MFISQVSSDPSLSSYDVIVLDEVHERHLHGDFLLGVVKCLVQQRSDLKVILMSATINIKLFQDYFHGEAPVIQVRLLTSIIQERSGARSDIFLLRKVPGRLYPIKLQYHPIPAIEQSSSEKLNPAPYVRILQLIDKKYPADERGDLLIFMSGLREITTVADACKERDFDDVRKMLSFFDWTPSLLVSVKLTQLISYTLYVLSSSVSF